MTEFSGTPISLQLGKDFRPFLWMCFQTMGIEPHDIQYDAALWLVNSGPRVVFSCMREFGKTIIVASYICWKLDLDPNYLFVVQCANQDKARSIIRLVLQLIQNTPELAYMAPIEGEHKKTLNMFDIATKTSVTRECSITAYGSSSEITGAHVHEVIADDLETRENSLTDLRQERLLELIREYEDLLISDIPTCRVIVIGTPQTQESIYFSLLEVGYEMMRLPSRYPELNNEHIDTLAPFLLKRLLDKDDKEAIPWAPTYPERKPEEYLVRKQMMQGDIRFYLQDLLDPSLSDADRYPLKLKNLIVYDSDIESFPSSLRWSNRSEHRLSIPCPGTKGDGFFEPEKISDNFTDFVERIMWVDPSGSGSDEVAWSVGLGIPGYVYIPEVGGRVDAFSDLTMQAMALTAKKYKVHRVLVEPNNGGGAYRKAMEPTFKKLNVAASLEDDKWSTGQKEARIIDTILPYLGTHKIVVSAQVASDPIWGHQFSHINYTKQSLPHDDRVESTWGVIKHLSYLLEEQEMDQTTDWQEERVRKAVEAYWGETPMDDPTPLGWYGLDQLGF